MDKATTERRYTLDEIKGMGWVKESWEDYAKGFKDGYESMLETDIGFDKSIKKLGYYWIEELEACSDKLIIALQEGELPVNPKRVRLAASTPGLIKPKEG